MPEPSYKLNPETERAFVRQLLADPLVMPRVARFLRAPGFEVPDVRDLVRAAISYWRKTQAAPTGAALLQEVREEVNAGRVPAARVAELASAMEDCRDAEPLASEYVVRRVLEAERDQALWKAIERSTKLYQEGRKDEVLAEFQKADAVGRVDSIPGVDYGGTLAHRTERRKKQGAPQRWGTGVLELDDKMDGGLTLDNPMGLVLGAPKVGKSMYLDFVALHTMRTGGFVVFFPIGDMGASEVISRHDASVALVPIREVAARAGEVEAKVSKFLQEARGGMHVKDFPGGMVTSCKDLDAYLEELRLEQSIRPSMIIADHAGEMAANEPSRHDRRHEELRAIASEFRALLKKHGCVGWTANHVTKEATEKKHPSLYDAAGAYSQVFVADAIVTIARSEEEKLDEKVRFYLAGSRFSGDGEPIGPLPSAYGVGRIVMG